MRHPFAYPTRFCLALFSLILCPLNTISAPLEVAKFCPGLHRSTQLGLLAFSIPWYHNSRSKAAYIPRDDATGIGIEIHWFNSVSGQINGTNIGHCDNYRILQSRTTNARLMHGEQKVQIDVPVAIESPFYDQPPMEFGRGTHYTPSDTRDKPWSEPPTRASTLAIYDTPYITDRFATEGIDIAVTFETCIVCQRASRYDSILGCGHWGYHREFIDSQSGWAEPDFSGIACMAQPSMLERALSNSVNIDYPYWLEWR
ncbi:MAG: hypothetical protein ACPG4U_08495 [Pseudomonadales bacterium]